MSNTRQIADHIKRYLTEQDINSLNKLHDNLNSAADQLLANPSDFDAISIYMTTINETSHATVGLASNIYYAKIDPYRNIGRAVLDSFCCCFFKKKPSSNEFFTVVYDYVLVDQQVIRKEQDALIKEPRIKKIDHLNNSVTFSDGLVIELGKKPHKTNKQIFDHEMTRLENENNPDHRRRKARN